MMELNLDIVQQIQEYAECTYPLLVPLKRKSGIQEMDIEQLRGEGDFMDLLATLTLFEYSASQNAVCSINITCGEGDKGDISFRIKGNKTIWNIKTSKYSPFHENLNLFVKEEELYKPMNGYIQAFIHLDPLEKEKTVPHIHFAGGILTTGKKWKSYLSEYEKNPTTIPRTNHKGMGIPVVDLFPIQNILKLCDKKF